MSTAHGRSGGSCGGFAVARCTVERLMASLGLQGVIRGKPVRTTVSDKADCRRRRGALGVVSAVECDAEVDGFKLPQPTPRSAEGAGVRPLQPQPQPEVRPYPKFSWHLRRV